MVKRINKVIKVIKVGKKVKDLVKKEKIEPDVVPEQKYEMLNRKKTVNTYGMRNLKKG